MYSSKVRIAVLVPYKVFPARTGGEKCIVLLYKYLARLRPLIAFGTNDNVQEENELFQMELILGKSFWRYLNPLLFFKLKKRIQQERITHLIIEHPYMGWLALWLKWTCQIKLIIHSHNIESIRFKSTGKWWWRLLWLYEKWTHRLANGSFFITEEDCQYAIQQYKIIPSKTTVITYGVETQSAPEVNSKTEARKQLTAKYDIPEDCKIILFNGTLDYLPNVMAVRVILEKINPLLLSSVGFKYKILICGKNLPAAFNALKDVPNIIYAGFVENINTVFLGADIFINPVIEGGGIKTKLVEALSYDMPCISTQSGAWGIPEGIVHESLHCVDDENWESFATSIIASLEQKRNNINEQFFDYFYWGNIADKAARFIDQC